MLDFQKLDDFLDPLARPDLFGAGAAQKTARRDRAGAQMRVQADQQIVDHRLVLEHGEILEGARNAEPRRARASASRVRSRPSNTMRPEHGRSTALIRLNSVVLPAPFGPIRLQIWPLLDRQS